MEAQLTSTTAKKARERKILDLIYGTRQIEQITPSERPDFILRHRSGNIFGVEIAELYASQTTARLERIPEYTTDLLDGGKFRHKDDAQSINVGKVDIVTDQNEVVYTQLDAIIQEAPFLTDCARKLATMIRVKMQKLGSLPATLSHINLVIHDRSGVLTTIPAEQFFRVYLCPELRTAVAAATFREVLFLTKMKDGTGFIPLKMLLLMAEVYFFNAIYTATESHKLFMPRRHELEVFGSYFAQHVSGEVLFRESADDSEIIHGDSGFVTARDGSICIRLYQDDKLPADAHPPEAGLARELGPEFMEKLAEHHASNTFSTPLLFATNAFQR